MLEGLYRLQVNGFFSSSKTTEEIKTEFYRISNPFRAWLNDCCIFLPEAYLTRKEAYNNYRDYSDDLGATTDSERTFYAKMRQTPKIIDAQKRINGKMERIFQGISVKPESEAGEADEAGSSYQTMFENLKNIEKNITPASSASFASKQIDIDKAVSQLQCFDCRRVLDENTPHTFHQRHPFCFNCFNKLTAQEKKWKCPELKSVEGQFFCNLIQSFLAKTEDCKPDCSLLTEEV